MQLTGTHTIDAPRHAVWEALLDPDVIAGTLPGCDGLEAVGENEYVAPIRVGVGPIEGKFEGRFTLSDIQPPVSYHLDIRGNGPMGFLKGGCDIRLEELEDAEGDQTLLHYDLIADIGGRVASVGQRLMESSAKLVSRKGLERLDEQIQTRIASNS